jgi:cyclin B
MKNQKDINQKMRSILIDWLVEVHNKFKLQPQTLWLCVNILDRYLEQVQTARSKLQLVGVTSLLIACKYEEIYPPEVKDCVYITDYAYDRAEVLAMETAILTKLEYKISIPTGYHFLIRYLNTIQASERTRHLASYYAERNLQESDMLLVRPHKFAAAALYAALKQQNDQYPTLHRAPIWTKTLQEESGLSEKDLKECARTIVKHVGEEPETASKRRLIAAKKKYGSEKYNAISNLSLPTL